MRKTSLLCFLLLFGCRDTAPGLEDGQQDAGPSFPDARVVRIDAGTTTEEIPPPTLSVVSPASGSELGGTRVILRGTSFVEPAEVFFGEASATSVVVLDEVSIAATTPPGAIGSVTVKVVTAGGEGELPAGFFYHKELRIIRVDPARIPEEGGVPVAILGRGFDEHTIVLIDRIPLRGARLIDGERIEGYAPALDPGRPEIRVINRDAEARRSDLLMVFATPEITTIAPGYGPITGGSTQEIRGSGLAEVTEVSVGDPVDSFNVLSAEAITTEVGSRQAGIYDVTVSNSDASHTLVGGFVVFNPFPAALTIDGIVPARAERDSGVTIAVVGNHFTQDTQLVIGSNRVLIDAVTNNVITAVLPQGLGVGAHDVVVVDGSDLVTATGALAIFAPITVDSITPNTGPAAGGTEVTISGSGFLSGAEVRIADVPLIDVVVLSETEITATTVAGSHGAFDVLVKTTDTRGLLSDGFTFEEAFEVIRIEPTEGSVAGNTYVSVIGRGLTLPAGVMFGGVDGLDPMLENGSIIGVRTQPASSGRVDVDVAASGEEVLLADAFSFYDPRLLTGGAWGGPIEGSVNVAVQTFNRDPIQGMVVQLGYDADLRYTAITDENGLATISGPEIRGAQTVTAGGPGMEFVTFTEINARNVSMFSSAYPTSMGPDDPVPPCPAPGEPPKVSGRVFKFKSSLDPVTRPGWAPVVRITYTQPNVFTTNPADPAEQVDFVFGDGEAYEIVVMRSGSVAVYGILYDYNPVTSEQIPRRMGIARNVPAAPGQVTEEIHLSLDIPLDKSVMIRLDNPPDQNPGPSTNAVFPFLNLESDGVIAFPPSAISGTGDVLINELPDLAESHFYYMGGSFTTGPDGGLSQPWSLTLLESGQEFEHGIDLGPFLEMPQNPLPKPNRLAKSGVMSWDQGGITPDVTTINVVDSVYVGGCCCIDANENGQCEESETQLCGGMGQQFNRWSIFGPGGLESYAMPRMPSGVQAFEPPKVYPWLVQQAIAPRFNYNEFIYNQWSPYFWKSWSVWYSQLLVKEETD